MRSVRLKELPATVVDDFVNMQLKKSYQSSINDDNEKFASVNNSMIGTPAMSGPFKVEYRLIKKKKASKMALETDINVLDSPSSLRYTSPPPKKTIKPPNSQKVLKPIEQNPAVANSQTFMPERKMVQTPELIKLSVQRLGSFDSVMFPLGRSIESASSQRPLPAIESPHQNGSGNGSNQGSVQHQFPTVGHRFICPHCKFNFYKDLVITVTEGTPDDLKQRQKSPDRASSNAGSVTMGTQTEDDSLAEPKRQKSVVKPVTPKHQPEKPEKPANPDESHNAKQPEEKPEQIIKKSPADKLPESQAQQKKHEKNKDEAVDTDRKQKKEAPTPRKQPEKVEKVEKKNDPPVVVEKPPVIPEPKHQEPEPEPIKPVDSKPPVRDEPEPEINLSSADQKLIESCRKIIKDAEADGTIEQIHSAIRQLAIVAQRQLSTTKGPEIRHGRLLCDRIGDIMAEESFETRLYQVLHALVNGWEFFTTDDSYHSTFNLFTNLTSYLSSSEYLAKKFLENTNLISQLLSILGYKKYINQLTQKNMWRFFDACLTILCHLTHFSSTSGLLRSAGVLQTLKKFLSTGELGYVGLWLPSIVAMSRIATGDEIATSVKAKMPDFVPPITGYIMTFFENDDDGDLTSRSLRYEEDKANDGELSSRHLNVHAASMMPTGASTQLVELTSAFVHFLDIVVDRNEAQEKDFHLSRSELEELAKCSTFLLRLPRPTHARNVGDKSKKTFMRSEWRELVRCGIRMASICHDLEGMLQLTIGDDNELKDEIILALGDIIKMEFDESDLKQEAEMLTAKLILPPIERDSTAIEQREPTPFVPPSNRVPSRDPTPPARSVTETIHQSANRQMSAGVVDNLPASQQDNTSVIVFSSNENWSSSLLTWTNSNVLSWMRSISLEKYEKEFEEYDGPMLLALYDVRKESPQYFQKEIATKLGGNFNNLVRFTAELTKLVSSSRLTPLAPSLTAGPDQQSLAISSI